MNKLYCLAISMIVLSGCSSINSIENPDQKEMDGLIYFMPKKDFQITVSVKDSKKSITVKTTKAYPDLSKQYVLKYRKNLVGKNTLKIGINEQGLLTSAHSATESQVTGILKNLAAGYGQISTASRSKDIRAEKKGKLCSSDGIYTFIYKTTGHYHPCGLDLTIKKVKETRKHLSHSKKEGKSYSGIYYRQNEPYYVKVHGNETYDNHRIYIEQIVFSPSDSPTHFLPISQTFFTDNDANFTFKEGIPTEYGQISDSELLALSKIPADILSSYFKAVGSMFNQVNSNNESEKMTISSSLELELVKKKYEACIEAIKEDNSQLIEQLGCRE